MVALGVGWAGILLGPETTNTVVFVVLVAVLHGLSYQFTVGVCCLGGGCWWWV